MLTLQWILQVLLTNEFVKIDCLVHAGLFLVVNRDTSARPYRYTITDKGRERVGSGEGDVVYAVSQ